MPDKTSRKNIERRRPKNPKTIRVHIVQRGRESFSQFIKQGDVLPTADRIRILYHVKEIAKHGINSDINL